MNYLEALSKILLTTESTSNELLHCLGQIEKEEDKDLLIKELTKDFNHLSTVYIQPKIQYIEEDGSVTTFPHYKKGKDDMYLHNEVYQNQLWLETEATSNWLERKEYELQKLELNNIKPTSTKKQIKVKNKFKVIQLSTSEKNIKNLYSFLSHNRFIIDCEEEVFLKVFGVNSEIINFQPQIQWVKGIDSFHYLFYFLDFYEFVSIEKDEISAKIYNGQFFVNAKNKVKPFNRLSKTKFPTKQKLKNRVTEYTLDNKLFKSKELEDIKDFKDLGDLIKSFKEKKE